MESRNEKIVKFLVGIGIQDNRQIKAEIDFLETTYKIELQPFGYYIKIWEVRGGTKAHKFITQVPGNYENYLKWKKEQTPN